MYKEQKFNRGCNDIVLTQTVTKLAFCYGLLIKLHILTELHVTKDEKGKKKKAVIA